MHGKTRVRGTSENVAGKYVVMVDLCVKVFRAEPGVVLRTSKRGVLNVSRRPVLEPTSAH